MKRHYLHPTRALERPRAFARAFRSSCLVGGLVLTAWSSARAQGGDAPLTPIAPYVAPAPAKCEWTITYSSPPRPVVPDQKETEAPTLKSERISKNGAIKRQIKQWSNNALSENWQNGAVEIQHEPTWAAGFLVAKVVSAPGDDFHLTWIDVKHFKGIANSGGKTCYLYEASDAIAHPGEKLAEDIKAKANDPNVPENIRQTIRDYIARENQAAATTATTKAWIDAKTMLPVAVQSGGVTAVYTFGALNESLSIPAAYDAEYRAFKRLYPNR